jgi:hypothetical protein
MLLSSSPSPQSSLDLPKRPYPDGLTAAVRGPKAASESSVVQGPVINGKTRLPVWQNRGHARGWRPKQAKAVAQIR